MTLKPYKALGGTVTVYPISDEERVKWLSREDMKILKAMFERELTSDLMMDALKSETFFGKPITRRSNEHNIQKIMA